MMHSQAQGHAVDQSSTSTAAAQQEQHSKVALVFGREVEGMTEAEINLCNATCAISIGRLQESLSLAHAVAAVLHDLFEHRLQHLPPEHRALYET